MSQTKDVLARLGVPVASPGAASDRLSELAASSGPLRAALMELRSEGISKATADALLSPRVADVFPSSSALQFGRPTADSCSAWQ